MLVPSTRALVRFCACASASSADTATASPDSPSFLVASRSASRRVYATRNSIKMLWRLPPVVTAKHW